MKKIASFIGLAAAVLTTSLVAFAGDMPANLGHPNGPGNDDGCFWDIDIGVENTCQASPPTLVYKTWDVPLPLTTGTYSVYANVYASGNGGTQAMRCYVRSYSYQSAVVSSPAMVYVPNTAAGNQTVLLGSVTVPLNGYAEAFCDMSQLGEYWFTVTW